MSSQDAATRIAGHTIPLGLVSLDILFEYPASVLDTGLRGPQAWELVSLLSGYQLAQLKRLVRGRRDLIRSWQKLNTYLRNSVTIAYYRLFLP